MIFINRFGIPIDVMQWIGSFGYRSNKYAMSSYMWPWFFFDYQDIVSLPLHNFI